MPDTTSSPGNAPSSPESIQAFSERFGKLAFEIDGLSAALSLLIEIQGGVDPGPDDRRFIRAMPALAAALDDRTQALASEAVDYRAFGSKEG
ncbi:MAG: hypothetical protein ACK4OP_00390 [Gemmobacter sp.]